MLNPTNDYIMDNVKCNTEIEQSCELHQEVWLHALEARVQRKSLMCGLIIRRAYRASRHNLHEYGGSGTALKRVVVEDPSKQAKESGEALRAETQETTLIRETALHQLLEAVYESADRKGDRESVEALLALYRENPTRPRQPGTPMYNAWRRVLTYAAKAKARLVAAGVWDDLVESLA